MTLVSDSQPAKASEPIRATRPDMVTFLSDVHPVNAFAPISVRPMGSVISVIAPLPAKAPTPMVDTTRPPIISGTTTTADSASL